ncbi:MAG: bifunctional phosphopantothenoylcysteine decarboxylase/phosphopantothenate--cysteine ligase CoaBC [Bacteroidetes bacterium]|nr:bifunctional phosphopantothenoylcysteine decarboxylase/phosphopantothenate--cysteine ligase CoaBC [Bacteroidota bacterium]
MPLKNKKILLGITGSIATYKAILLVRLLIKSGAEIKVVMTNAAKDFVSPLVLSVLSKNKVYIEWQEENEWNNHVELGRWADVFVIAPLTCNTLSKMANGGCDNLLLAVYLSATCPVVVAPAMDEEMWLHPSTKKNINRLIEYGNQIIEVKDGELASGIIGSGRLTEPEDIITYLEETIFRDTLLKGKKVLVSAGPTYEAIDPVRFIGNRSSGKMGFAIAEAFYLRGADVVLVSGPTHERTRFKGIDIIRIENADEMFHACLQHESAHIMVMSAAVADYTALTIADQKIKKQGDSLQLNLTKTKDILKYLGNQKKPGQYVAGFALETENEIGNATKKLLDKNADCIILNSMNDKGAGFEKDTNKISIINQKSTINFEVKTKKDVANDIVNYILDNFNPSNAE